MHKPLIQVVSLVFLLALSTGCAPSNSGERLNAKVEPSSCEVSGQSFGIVGGSILGPNNDLSSSTVIVIHVKDGKESICTGTLIDNDKVLTAAHCTSRAGGTDIIAFTNNLDCAVEAPKRTARAVTAKSVHSQYTYNSGTFEGSSYDLAILKFKGDLAPGYQPRPLPHREFNLLSAEDVIVAGYGVTSEKAKDNGTLRFTTASPERLSKDFYMNILKKNISLKNTIILDQPENGVCKGDSGGPLYAYSNGQLVLVGITSMGIDNRADSFFADPRFCHGVGVFTDVRAHLDWIHDQMSILSQ